MSDYFQQNIEAFDSARESLSAQVENVKNAYLQVHSVNTAEKAGEALEMLGGTTSGLIGSFVGIKHLINTLKGGTKANETATEEEVAENNAEEGGEEAGEISGEAAAEGGAPAAATVATETAVEEGTEEATEAATDFTEGVSTADLGDGIAETTFSTLAPATVPADVSMATAEVGNSMASDLANNSLAISSTRITGTAQTAIEDADPEGIAGPTTTTTAAEGGEAAAEGGEAAVAGGEAAATGGEAAIEGGIVTTDLAVGAAAAPETLGLSLVGAAIVAGITTLVGDLVKTFGGKVSAPKVPNIMSLGPDLAHTPEGPAAAVGSAF